MFNQMTSVFSESNYRRIYHSTSTSTLLVLSASFNYDSYAASDVLWMTTLSLHSFMRSSRAESLLRQSPDWRSEEDDRQVATCPQLGSTNRLEHAQVPPGTYSFPAQSATLAGCCRPGSVQSLRPGVQMSAQKWLLNTCLPILRIRLRHFWPSSRAIG